MNKELKYELSLIEGQIKRTLNPKDSNCRVIRLGSHSELTVEASDSISCSRLW